MDSTSASLLDRLRQPNADEAWSRFVELYTPLLYYWALGQRLGEADAGDLVQEVLLLLLKKLPEFEYQGNGSFRSWLRTVTLNKLRESRRRKTPQTGGVAFDDLAADDSVSRFEENEYRAHLVHHLLNLIKDQFQPNTWQLFDAYVIQGKDPRAVAREHGVNPGVVYGAKSKVLQRVRQELQGLID
jgi:RNA polymerase sigma-70 factor (ECF subfamily)